MTVAKEAAYAKGAQDYNGEIVGLRTKVANFIDNLAHISAENTKVHLSRRLKTVSSTLSLVFVNVSFEFLSLASNIAQGEVATRRVRGL